jgi:SNF2 family DNA or RNA helicase
MTDSYKFKTTPFAHQLEVFKKSRDAEYFALLMEQGTGKSKVIIDTAAYLWGKGRINAMVVVAPNGVHQNWDINEIPIHMPEYVERHVAVWTASQNKKQKKALDDLFLGGVQLRVLCMNVEALSTKRGFDFLVKFLRATDALLLLDESTRIKNPQAVRTKNLMKARKEAKYRRIATGTPVTKSPFDAFSQFNFLSPDVIGIPSFVAFKSRYAKLLDASSPLIAKIMRNGARFMPQIVAQGPNGSPIYQNLEELADKIAEHSYRVLKKDCLDLPDKLYSRHYYEMEPIQKAAYKEMVTKMRSLWNGEQVTAMNKLTMIVRCQQIVSGYFAADGDENLTPMFAKGENPKINALLDLVEDLEGGVIIWCRFTQEIRDLHAALSARLGSSESVAMFYGAIDKDDRMDIVKGFQDGRIKFFIGNAQSGGTGLTLTAAQTVIYYSNWIDLELRLQSEDRAHRVGQVNKVTYYDMECLHTYDTKIIAYLRERKTVADIVTGDPAAEWL